MSKPGPGPTSPEILPPLLLPDGKSIAIRLRRSARAARMALRIAPGEQAVTLVLPTRAALAHGLAFAATRAGWIAQQLARMPARIAFAEGAAIPVLGRERRLVAVGPGLGRAPPFRVTEATIEVTGAPAHLVGRTRRGLAALAREQLAERSARMAARIGRKVANVAVGDARSRWGSCSASGNLRFSWRLILAPEPVLDYVVAHEVAHLAEMNHGPRFWRLVETLAPDYKVQRAWLRTNARQLLRYG